MVVAQVPGELEWGLYATRDRGKGGDRPILGCIGLLWLWGMVGLGLAPVCLANINGGKVHCTEGTSTDSDGMPHLGKPMEGESISILL